MVEPVFTEWNRVHVPCPKCRAPCNGRMSRVDTPGVFPFCFALEPGPDGVTCVFMRGVRVFL
jgi:hypothetical protein